MENLRLGGEAVPKIILVTFGPEACDKILKLLIKFINVVGDKIPANVRLQFPNGRDIHVHYNKKLQDLVNLKPLYNELGGNYGFFLNMEYVGKGIFKISVIGKDFAEVEYVFQRKIARAPVTYQDKISGKRWKFMARVMGPIYINGSIPIPPRYLDRFRDALPREGTAVLKTGEELKLVYMKAHGRLYGFKPIIEKCYVGVYDIIVIAYRGNGRFLLDLYDNSRTERLLRDYPIIIDSDTTETSGEREEGVQSSYTTDMDTDESSIEHRDGLHSSITAENAAVEADIEGENNDLHINMQFSKILTRSNTDQSTHGVSIPAFVKPRNREWVAGETVSLRTERGTWEVKVVLNKKHLRFSGGWNKFCLDNSLEENQTLTFTLVDGGQSIVFNVI